MSSDRISAGNNYEVRLIVISGCTITFEYLFFWLNYEWLYNQPG